ncbi:MAG: HAMP domain-containing protein [Rhodospirillaceae bacterium]|jgi:two-component system osmolarity sensor histidine kinase EnvZ|nr:HAMP domain-containing protein [Rhodospirillaceae bacterium]MBT3809965.1 HAMP domain-containing protein [Rhodospirillaceae bacterium]MBT3929296.1 HAMP domain-containing protein [Rhodospirillaceae bacterium]MBT4770864.1 HAMP domain-containing protein [Rhodospirillaceae bacterium]MBT5357364.1 HAMP domain-containing protein [Rhodospirillaceae bacterium]
MARLEALIRVPRILRLTLKQLLPRGLLARSLLIIVVPLVLLQVVSGVIFYDRHWSNVSRHRATALAGDISMVMALINEDPGSGNQSELFELARRTLDLILEYKVGTILPNTHFEPAGNLEITLSRSLREIVQRPFVIDTGSQRDRVLIDVQLSSGVLKVSANEERLISSTTKIFIFWMIGTSLILFAVATLFMRNQVSPIRRLATAAENFGKGRDTPNFRPSGATEVRQAASAFMAMRNRLERQIQQRTDMLSGVSHDLRTPLTRMKLQLAMLNTNTEIDELNSDVAAMESMIEGYLNFARGEGTEERQLIDAGTLLEEVAHDARRNGADITLHIDEPVELPLARAALRRCLTNLADNAARHAEKIEMGMRRNGSVLEIMVDDDGPGIPEDMRDEVFRPFFRLDESRNMETGGTGLGLSIAQDIVHAHGGEISLGESPAGGLRVLIRIPI